jgi:hypothetical protein
MDEKSAALSQIQQIARQHNITAEEISDALSTTDTEPGKSTISRILAYIGGVFVLCGLAFFFEIYWDEMNSASRIILYLGSGLVLLVMAVLSLDHDRYAKTATPLFLLAAFFQAGGLLVAFDELGTGGDPQHAWLATTLVMLVQMLIIFFRFRRAVLLFLVFTFGLLSLANCFDLLGIDGDLNALIVGASLLFISYGLDKTAFNPMTPFWYFVAGVTVSCGAFELLEETTFHVIYIGFAALLIYLSTIAKSRTLLFVACCAMIGYLGYFSAEYFVDSVGWPLSLMIMGLVLILLSTAAAKISRTYIANEAQDRGAGTR